MGRMIRGMTGCVGRAKDRSVGRALGRTILEGEQSHTIQRVVEEERDGGPMYQVRIDERCLLDEWSERGGLGGDKRGQLGISPNVAPIQANHLHPVSPRRVGCRYSLHNSLHYNS